MRGDVRLVVRLSGLRGCGGPDRYEPSRRGSGKYKGKAAEQDSNRNKAVKKIPFSWPQDGCTVRAFASAVHEKRRRCSKRFAQYNLFCGVGRASASGFVAIGVGLNHPRLNFHCYCIPAFATLCRSAWASFPAPSFGNFEWICMRSRTRTRK